MRDWQWDEIVQHPDRPLTRGQVELLREANIAALNCERRSALCLRLIIEVDRLERNARLGDSTEVWDSCCPTSVATKTTGRP